MRLPPIASRVQDSNTGIVPRRLWVLGVFVCLILAVAGIAVWGFYRFDTQLTSPPREVGALRFGQYILFTLSTFVLRFPLEGGVALPWQLEVARVVAPTVLGLGGVLAFVRDTSWRLRHIALLWQRKHVIIMGVDDNTIRLAERLIASGRRVVLVDDAQHLNYMPAIRALRLPIVAGPPEDPLTWRAARLRHATHCIIRQQSDAASLSIATRLLLAPGHDAVQLVAIIDDVALDEQLALDSAFLRAIAPQRLRFVQPEQIAARLLLQHHPLDAQWRGSMGIRPQDATRAHLVVLGESDLAVAILMHAARIGHFANGTRLAITLLGSRAARLHARVLAIAPAFASTCDIEVVSSPENDHASWSAVWDRCGQAPTLLTISVCGEHDEENLRHLWASQLPPKSANVQHMRALVQTHADPERLVQCLPPGVVLACVPALAMTAEHVLTDVLDAPAKRIHERYLASIGTPDPARPAHQPWHALSAAWRNSNRIQADHTEVKLRALGKRIVPNIGAAQGIAMPSLEVSPRELEALARCEHQRWIAERVLTGWRHDPVRDDARKLHPSIAAWETLTDKLKDLDRDTIRGLADTLQTMGVGAADCELNQHDAR